MGKVEDLLDVSAHDTVGDQRAQMAKETFESSAHMVCFVASDSQEEELRTNGILLDGSIWNIYDEAIANLVEATRVWSHARADEAVIEIGQPINVPWLKKKRRGIQRFKVHEN